MDRNSLIGLVLIVVILIGFTWWLSPSEEEKEQMRRRQDSVSMAERRLGDSLKATELHRAAQDTQAVTGAVVADTQAPGPALDLYGSFANAATGENKKFTLENDKVKITLSSKGGGISKVEVKGYRTFDQQPLILYRSDTSLVSFTFFSNNRDVSTRDLFFQPAWSDGATEGKDSMTVTGGDSLTFAMRLYPDAPTDTSAVTSNYIEYRYTLRGDDYMTGFSLALVGMQNYLPANMNYLNLDWRMDMMQQEKSHENEKNSTTVYYKYLNDEVDYLSETKYQKQSLASKVKWVSFKQQFFSAALVADEAFSSAEVETFTTGDTSRYLKSMSAVIGIPVDLNRQQSLFPMKFYFGPNKYRTFRKYDLDLERQIPLGWSFFLMAWINKYAVIPVFDFLSGFRLNYGIIILILTILLKIVLFPIAYKTYLSSAKMRVLKPEVDEIAKKFPKKDDTLKKQQATMDLYKRAGINPMSGCVPMLLQLPILIAMFRFFPASIELRQQPFLWADDLSSYDSILDLPFSIPFYGDHVSLFCLLMTISTIIYTRISNEMMASGSQQMPGMKTMMYLMPVIFLGFFNNYSSGLSYYYLLANLITFAQMFIIRRVIDEKKIHAQIQENKKKPVKKSNFQKRLEEMANKRGYPAKR